LTVVLDNPASVFAWFWQQHIERDSICQKAVSGIAGMQVISRVKRGIKSQGILYVFYKNVKIQHSVKCSTFMYPCIEALARSVLVGVEIVVQWSTVQSAFKWRPGHADDAETPPVTLCDKLAKPVLQRIQRGRLSLGSKAVPGQLMSLIPSRDRAPVKRPFNTR
jgi:hypothetical protein